MKSQTDFVVGQSKFVTAQMSDEKFKVYWSEARWEGELDEDYIGLYAHRGISVSEKLKASYCSSNSSLNEETTYFSSCAVQREDDGTRTRN